MSLYSQFIEMFGDPIKNPNGLPVAKLEELVEPGKDTLKAGPFGSSLKKSSYTSSGYKIYGQEQVISGDPYCGDYYISEEKYKGLISCSVKPGDFLISLVGTFGKTMVLPDDCAQGIINPRLIKIRFDKTKINPYFFQQLFASDAMMEHLESNTHGTTMGVLNLGILKRIMIIVPPMEDQNRFVEFVEQSDKSKFELKQAIKRIDILIRSLIQQEDL